MIDLDGTVFNFPLAERRAFMALCEEFNIDFSEDKYLFYEKANKKRWQQYEMGLLKKEDILLLRFKDFLDEYHIDLDCKEPAKRYMDLLPENSIPFEGMKDFLYDIKKRYEVAAVTNGGTYPQKKKLKLNNMEDCFHHLFISEEIGFPKPKQEFFDAVFSYYKDVPRENFLLIGDSLTSDIKGANLSGIKSLWLSFGNEPDSYAEPDYIVKSPGDLYSFLKEEI